MKYEDYLAHFNPNHDPRNGQFTSSQMSYANNSIFKKRVVSDPKEKVQFRLRDNSGFAKMLARFIPSVKKTVENCYSYDITDKNGQSVGHMELERLNNNILYGSWISINGSEQGKGYGSSAMRMVLKEAKKNGFKQMNIEVPGISPDARHIYEKNGFVVTKAQPDLELDDIWGGLTRMTKKL